MGFASDFDESQQNKRAVSGVTSPGGALCHIGDHNMEPHECGPMLEGLSSKVVIKHAGVSCVTQAKLSILDYAIVSHQVAKVDLEMRTISSTLATHRPFHISIKGETNTQHLKTFRPNRVVSFKAVKGPQLEGQWQQWHDLMDSFENRFPRQHDSVLGQYWGVPQHSRNLQQMMASWQKIAINEIQANLGVKLEDPYKTPHRPDKVEVSQDYAMQWAIRRVQEASCINQTNRDARQRAKWGEGICAKIHSYQKQELIYAEWQGCKSIRAHMDCPVEHTREQLQNDKESMQKKLDLDRSTRAKTRYRERDLEIKTSVEKGTSLAFRMLREPQPLYQAKVEMGGIFSQCIHLDIKRQAESWGQLWDYQGTTKADVVITKKMGIKCPPSLSPLSTFALPPASSNPQLCRLTSCTQSILAFCPLMRGERLPGFTLPSSWQGISLSRKGRLSPSSFPRAMEGSDLLRCSKLCTGFMPKLGPMKLGLGATPTNPNPT